MPEHRNVPTLPEVEEALRAPEWKRRAWAATHLAAFAPDTALPMLRRALHDQEDTAVTQAAMETLLVMGTPDAQALLLDALINGDEETADHLYFFLRRSDSEVARQVVEAYDDPKGG
jgi:HEAT repeat protein